MSAGASPATTTIAIIAGVRQAAAGTMTTMTAAPCLGVMRKAGSPDRAHVIATTMTIAAIPARAPATRRAGSPARDRVIAVTTTTDAAAGTAVGSAIRRA